MVGQTPKLGETAVFSHNCGVAMPYCEEHEVHENDRYDEDLVCIHEPLMSAFCRTRGKMGIYIEYLW